jgi:hypothetical protein
MTKTQLLADLAANYGYITVGTPVAKTAIGDMNTYIVTVVAAGLSELNKKPVASPKDIVFYVNNEGLGGEAAYYGGVEPTNTINTDVTISTSSYQAIANLYNSDALQARVLSAVLAMSSSVFQENSATSSTSVTIGTGSKSFTLGPSYLLNVLQFSYGMTLVISSGANTMTGTVTSYNSATGALVANIATTNGSGTFTSWTFSFSNHTNRMKIINAANTAIGSDVPNLAMWNVVMRFMGAIALNSAVQAAGTAVDDATLLTIISNSWDAYASLIA